jgi:uncharacterized protein YraI
MPKFTFRPLQWLFTLSFLFILTACGGDEPEPTATPTKTPASAAAAPTATATTAASQTNNAGQLTLTTPPLEEPTATPAQTETVGTVTADLLNIRSEPSTSGAIVDTANNGERFAIVGRSQDGVWLQVAENGKLLGWAAAEFLQVQQDAPIGPAQPTQATQPGNTGQQPTPTSPPNTVNFAAPNMRSPDFGAQAFLWWRPELTDRDLGLMRDAGFNWVKQAFAWETIEGVGKGQFDWSIADRVVKSANAQGLQLLARLSSDPELQNFWAGKPPGNSDHFADFAGAIAARYNCTPQSFGCIHAFQIWNEPNLGREWGGNRPNPAQYVEFLRKAYAKIKAVSPNAIVISAGMAPTGDNSNIAMPDDLFYEEMYKAMGGNSGGYFDMLGVHGAGFAAPPELDPAEAAANPQYGGYRFFAFRHVEDIRRIMVNYGDANKKIVLLEFGWTYDPVNSAYKWHGADAGINEFVQGDYLKRAYIYAAQNWQPWIGLMSLITMPNLDWNQDGNPQDEEQYWWAIMEPSNVNELKFRAAFIILCDYFNRQRGQLCVKYDPALQKP